MQKRKKLQSSSLIFGVIMLLSLAGMLYFGHKKEGFHVDEVYSYGLANSEYLPFMHFGENGYDVKDWMLEYGAGETFGDLFRNLWKDYQILKENDFQVYSSSIYRDYLIAQENSADTRTTTWMSGEEYLHYISVSPSNTFNYPSVYYNQRGDVHPPFFYMLLHTVCSFFPENFSKWYGMGINMLFMLLTLIVLYRLCSKYLGDKKFGLCVAAVYGLSCGFVSTAIFIRMYAILTFMVVASCYLHLEISGNDFELSKKSVFKLAAVTFLGFYTHYYFVLYAIAAAAVFCIWMLCKKYYKKMAAYIITMAATGAAGVCIWPFAIRHVFHGYRGMGAVQESLAGGAYLLKIRLMLDLIWSQIAGGVRWLPVCMGGVLIITALLWKRKQFPWGKVAFLGIPIIFYVSATAQIVPFYTERYVMCSYFFWCILMAAGAYYPVHMICGRFGLVKNKRTEALVNGLSVCLILGLVLLNNCYTNPPGYLYAGGQGTIEVPKNTDYIYVLPDGSWNETAKESTVMAQCRNVGVVYESQLPVLGEGYYCKSGDHLMVCIHNEMETEKVLKELLDILQPGEMQEINRREETGEVRILLKKE